jgi:hypothetical protein
VALSVSPAGIGAFGVGLFDVDAVVEEPVDASARGGVVPGYLRQIF